MELSTVSDDGHVLRLRASGRITQEKIAPSSDELGDLLGVGGYARRVVLNLADVDFIDTSGISWLLARHKRFRQASGKLVLHSLMPMVLEVLKVLRLHRVFHLADNEPAAVALVQGGQP
jgi:anti-anti-sigma factor